MENHHPLILHHHSLALLSKQSHRMEWSMDISHATLESIYQKGGTSYVRVVILGDAGSNPFIYRRSSLDALRAQK